MGKNFKNIDLPCIMGILNVTPDSFSDGGKFYEQRLAEKHLRDLVNARAAVVDIGGESTKPQGISVDSTEEWRRVESVVKIATQMDSIAVCVDTYHVDVAALALKNGANVVNDVCGTWHFDEMVGVIKGFDAHLIVVHNSRNDANFAKLADPVSAIVAEFERVLDRAIAMNFDADWIIFDPGLGFGKTARQNLEIFRRIGELCSKFSNPILCATSKKSFLGTAMESDSPAALSAATAITTGEGFRMGCKIFRVHDVEENFAALKFAKRLYG
jgi:dihydropteroate synthase